jgi:hypothetical protein
MEVVALGTSRVHVMPVIRGLVSEAESVRAAISEVSPETVGLSISREELEALRSYGGGNAPPDNVEEEAYVRGLGRFGEIQKPPPCFVEAVRVASGRSIPVHPLDMDDEQYTSVYVASVSTVDILLANARARRLRKWESTAESAMDFVREWDAFVNGSKGYRRLQEERESFIARRIRQLAGARQNLLVVLEVERSRGVLERLRP